MPIPPRIYQNIQSAQLSKQNWTSIEPAHDLVGTSAHRHISGRLAQPLGRTIVSTPDLPVLAGLHLLVGVPAELALHAIGSSPSPKATTVQRKRTIEGRILRYPNPRY